MIIGKLHELCPNLVDMTWIDVICLCRFPPIIIDMVKEREEKVVRRNGRRRWQEEIEEKEWEEE